MGALSFLLEQIHFQKIGTRFWKVTFLESVSGSHNVSFLVRWLIYIKMILKADS